MRSLTDWGALLFGVVVGWITYRTLVRRTGGAQISDIAAVIGAVGGSAVTVLFHDPRLFGLYSIGLFAGFFAYLILFYLLNDRKKTAVVMGEDGLGQPRLGDAGRLGERRLGDAGR
jgi:uncharacterized membrane protein YeaQ/YmgE (transglycosylase-associated protein family)